MKVLVVQTWLHRDLIEKDADLGRRMVLRIARQEARSQTAAIKTYEVSPGILFDGTMSVRAHVWVD